MPTVLPTPSRARRAFPAVGVSALLILCIAPIVALFSVGAWLGRDCVLQGRREGDAGVNFVWRIETERCGQGPAVTNVLVAPRGKTLALAASSTGSPKPIGVHRGADGVAFVLLEGEAGGAPRAVMLPLKASGRPATPLVLSDGLIKR